ncbi:MAG: SusC/RagA family TonB-linked outer membrane protein [Bacteroidales bacterium]
MKKLTFLITLLLFFAFQAAAQTEISGTVTDAETGEPIPGVSVVVKEQESVGTTTNMDGEYNLTGIPSDAETLIFSFVGMQTQEVPIEGRSTINVEMQSAVQEMEEVVVTALGISREKKALGYSVQDMAGDDINEAKETNFISSLSGRTSGVNIKQPNTMGGSANIVIRGRSSLLGNNQALFVVDGVIVDNSITNDNTGGWGGYDYGNAASDINPDNIESISVLKSAAATALYGSRASNGAIVIETKSGEKREKLGITVNSSYQMTEFDPATMPKWQDKYGAGYGAPYYLYAYDDPADADQWDPYFLNRDINGDGELQKVAPTWDDASWGAPFSADLEYVPWYNLHPLSENFGETVPWESPGKNSYRAFFEKGYKYTNSIALEGGGETTNYRVNYTRLDESGNLPNSEIERNTLNFSGSLDLSDKWTAEAAANYLNSRTLGRYGTGYNGINPMQQIGQWTQVNVDYSKLEKYEYEDGSQRTWNWHDPQDDLRAYYMDNPYWTRYKNYTNDGRDRVYGFTKLSYEAFDWLTLSVNLTNDYYSTFREERMAIGSAITGDLPDYTKNLRNFNEFNGKFHAQFNKDIGDWGISGLLGTSMERRDVLITNSTTEGGLALPDFYDIDNSVAPPTVDEGEIHEGVNSVYGQASVGWKDMAYVDVTGRNDESSTLPEDNNSYFYPSVSGSLILSEFNAVKNLGFFSYAKLSANYAEVGSSTSAYRTTRSYNILKPWDGYSRLSIPTQKNNPDLRPEITKSWEVGTDLRFFNDRAGINATYYQASTYDQILPLSTSSASGYYTQMINAGEMENIGVELTLDGTPVETNAFSWNFTVNWSKNENKVVSLGDDIDNILYFSAWDVTVNATEGEPAGAIKGTDYVYHEDNGKPMVNDGGMPMRTDKDKILGNINPDWNAGISNRFSYRNLTLRVLVDIQQGGDIYSVNTKYGQATGVYEETAGKNPRGGDIRGDLEDDGGYLYEDFVKEDGSQNDIYVETQGFTGAFYYGYLPTATHVYDASYVKLRELSLSYNLPDKFLTNLPFARASVSFIARNPWIIHKNTKHFDPEAILSAGNNQGIESGSYPSTRSYGINLQLKF